MLRASQFLRRPPLEGLHGNFAIRTVKPDGALAVREASRVSFTESAMVPITQLEL